MNRGFIYLGIYADLWMILNLCHLLTSIGATEGFSGGMLGEIICFKTDAATRE